MKSSDLQTVLLFSFIIIDTVLWGMQIFIYEPDHFQEAKYIHFTSVHITPYCLLYILFHLGYLLGFQDHMSLLLLVERMLEKIKKNGHLSQINHIHACANYSFLHSQLQTLHSLPCFVILEAFPVNISLFLVAQCQFQ